jgi:hypothetical protein
MSRIKLGGSVVPTVPRATAPLAAARGPEQMRWRPLITFIRTAMDAANAMVSVPGEFGSFGHDYRADMVRFVRDAYALPAASDAQVARIEAVLRSLELERAERIKATHAQADPPAPAHGTAPPTRTPPPACRCESDAPPAPLEPAPIDAPARLIPVRRPDRVMAVRNPVLANRQLHGRSRR